MENFKVDAKALAAASVTAAKQDVRYYLEGVLIGEGRMVSTDGHRMTVIECPNCESTKEMEPKIFKLFGKVPALAVTAKFTFTEDDRGVIFFRNSRMSELSQVVKFEVVNGRFPDYRRVMPTGEQIKTDVIGFNLEYLADAHKIGSCLNKKYNSGKFEIYDKLSMVTMKSPELEAKYIVMSVRL